MLGNYRYSRDCLLQGLLQEAEDPGCAGMHELVVDMTMRVLDQGCSNTPLAQSTESPP